MEHPIFVKLQEAAEVVALAQNNLEHKAISPNSVLLAGVSQCHVHVSYQQATGGIILAFVAQDDWDQITKDRFSGRAVPSWAPDADIKVHKSMLAQVDSLVHAPQSQGGQGNGAAAAQPPLMDVMTYLTGGFIPRRILCTGFSLGGGLASVAALWAALSVPTADVRCITFGAPRAGNKDFAAAFVNAVGAQYRVVYEADPTPHHPRPVFYMHAGHPIWVHEGKFLFQDERSVEQRQPDHDFGKYLQSLRAKVGAPQERNVTRIDTAAGAVHDKVSSAADTVAGAVGGAVSAVASILPGAFGANSHGCRGRGCDDFAARKPSASVVALILEGKIAQATLLAWRAYEDEAAFRKLTGLEHAKLLTHEQLDTQVYVAWLEGGTAVFAFRGTESAQDAKADIDARSTPVEWMADDYPSVRGHMGFMNQFKSVCDPEVDDRHIGIVLDELSGGVTPTRVLCCGHSLGGALATLAAAWAAYEYPRADVRCITLGSPRVGNHVFSGAMKYLVGGVHRLVHGWDPVPTMPPPTGFKHVKGRMFLYKHKCRFIKRPWYMSYGLLCGRVGDHNVDPYAAHITAVTGREIAADQLGLLRTEATAAGDLGKLDARPVAAASDAPEGGLLPHAQQVPAEAAAATASPPEAAAGAECAEPAAAAAPAAAGDPAFEVPAAAAGATVSAAPPPEAVATSDPSAAAFPLATPMIDFST
eukprot:jgi/Ulvmu1/10638/UM066_0018.1